MSNQINRIYVPVILALGLIWAIFVLRPAYTSYIDTDTKKVDLTTKQNDMQKNLDALISLQTSINSSGSSEIAEKVRKLNQGWDEAKIMTAIMLSDYTKWNDIVPPSISISTISIDKGKKLPSGLSFGSITLTLSSDSIDNVVDFLTYLTSSSSYIFTLDTIQLPITAPAQKETQWVTLPIELGVYYYE